MKLSGFFILCLILCLFSLMPLAHAEEQALLSGVTQFETSSDISKASAASTTTSAATVSAVSGSQKSSGDSTAALSNINAPAKILGIKKELFFKCVRGKELRWMRLNYLKNGKCKTVYSKEGNAKEVSKEVDRETCETILKNIKMNLESGGYTCEEKILMGALELE